MHDALVLSACIQDRKAYDRVARFVDKHEFTPMAGYWWELVADWYARDNSAVSVDRAILRERGSRKANEKHREAMLGYFDSLPTVASSTNVVSELLAVKRHVKGNELASQLGGDEKELLGLAREFVELLEADSLEEDTWKEAGDWAEAEEALSEANRIRLLPLNLNRRCGGGAVRGDHIVIFGPTEIGKSLFAVNMVCGFLRQGLRVLYVSNEDAAIKVRDRVLCNLAHVTPEEVKNNRADAIRAAESKFPDGTGFHNLLVGNMAPGDIIQIERIVDQFKPDVLVIDQLRNLHATRGEKRSNATNRLDQVAQEVRALLIRKQMVGVSMMQAYAGEHGKPTVWYSADDVDSSRVGVPGQADLLVALGADETMMLQNVRAVSLCKNKLGGNHEGFLIEVDPKRSKCK